MIYVALLRGINVGGKNKIEMATLKLSLESIGCEDVLTYINSGNIIFTDNRQESEIVNSIEAVIRKDFDLNIPVVIRSAEKIRKICVKTPEKWKEDKQQRTYALFLWKEIDDEKLMTKLTIKPDIDRVMYMDGVIVWNVDRTNITRSGMMKLMGTDLYKHITIRNINTIRKLDQLISGVTGK